MTKSHNRYRAAKRFKLNDDLEVDDCFCGGKKTHVKRGWDFYDGRRHSLYSNHMGVADRFLASKVGKPWDDVNSMYVKRTKTIGGYFGRELRSGLRWKVQRNTTVVDGVPCELSRWSGYREIDSGGLYVDPTTGILSRAPVVARSRNKPYPRASWRMRDDPHEGLQVARVDDVKYVREVKEHRRRIASGVFETEQVFVWFKYVPYEYEWTTYDWVRDSEGEYVKIYRTKSETRFHKYQASKKAIKKYGLTYEKE